MKFSVLDALRTTLVAMTIVFVLLIVLQYIIRLQSFILNFIGKKGKGPKVDVIHKQEEVKDEEAVDKEEEEEEIQPLDDLEVVAVITAALSAYLDIPGSSLKIKRIKRVNSNWSSLISSVENDK